MSDTAILIANYGTPRSAKKCDVRRYLRQLLDNRHVMTMNPVGRKLLVNCIIAPCRAKKSAALYSRLDTINGEMPLLAHTKDFCAKVQAVFNGKADVYFGMTAGDCLLKDVLKQIYERNYRRVIVVPMFPQYTESTVVNIIDGVFSFFAGKLSTPYIYIFPEFYSSPFYLESMKILINNALNGFEFDKIIFSYHGVPLSHIDLAHKGKTCNDLDCKHLVSVQNSKCYLAQCFATTRLICNALNISEEKAITSFQSRFRDDWVQPSTDAVVREEAKRGTKRIAVVTPSFTVDCLETTVEISDTLSQTFISCGGEDFRSVPCLNAEDFWVERFCAMISNVL